MKFVMTIIMLKQTSKKFCLADAFFFFFSIPHKVEEKEQDCKLKQ